MLRQCLILVGSMVATWIVAAERPNVLLICVDDLKPVLGCYGDPIAKTPNIDRLAQRGVLFQSAYCNQAVCSPSRNALLTSLRPQTLGIYDLPTNFRRAAPDAVTLPQYFQSQGYRTQAMGKIFHVGHGNGEDAASWTVPHWRPKTKSYVLPESTQNPKKQEDPRGNATEGADVPDETFADGAVAAEAIQRLTDAAKQPDQPFFIAVGFIKPHLPFVAPKKYWDLYDASQLPMPQVLDVPEGAPSYAPQFGGELRQYADMPNSGPIDTETTRRLIHGYYAATSYTDAQVGRLLEKLDHLHLTDQTIVVLWGDHGWHLGDHGMWCKHTNYEQAARIPVIVSAPGAGTGNTQAMLESVDLYPTLCELAGLAVPSGLDGISQMAVVRDPSQKVRDSVIHVYPRSQRLGRAIRTARYRLVQWKAPGADASEAEYELYDYAEDRLETRNLANERPEVVAELKALLARHPEAKPQVTAQPKKETTKKKSSSSPQDRVSMFRKRDQDGDGKLTREEFLRNQPDPEEAPQRFPRFDTNNDGVLSEAEFVKSGK